MLFKILNCDTIIAPVVGDKCLCLTYYVHLAGIKEAIDYKNVRSGKLQTDDTETQSDSQTDA